jgi:glycosyltransferase involved in cell wall biosynthesis
MRSAYNVVCLSHLRWDFVYQRPQHLLSRCAQEHRVFFVEEPVLGSSSPRLDIRLHGDGIWIIVPHLPEGLDPESFVSVQRKLMDELLDHFGIEDYVLWYCTAMAVPYTRHLRPLATVYDCMDELSAFRDAPPALRVHEAELFDRADLVFTGGQSLYEAKRARHHSVHLFPSSVDVAHFARARDHVTDPDDQAAIPHPRLGYCGVIDERMDIDLLATLAESRPDWQLVMVGPVVKIDPASLPQRDNVHYLGPKRYQELPLYLAGWDVALLPFALNDSTRYISPTKTPEYLAAGKPVVSTPIRDVVRPYGTQDVVRIAASPEEFVAAIDATLTGSDPQRQSRADALLARMSWDETWRRMETLVETAVARRSPVPRQLLTRPIPVTPIALDRTPLPLASER